MDSSREQTIHALEMMPLLQERLAAGQRVRGLRFSGVSMRPMLREGKDTVELTAAPEMLTQLRLRGRAGNAKKACRWGWVLCYDAPEP